MILKTPSAVAISTATVLKMDNNIFKSNSSAPPETGMHFLCADVSVVTDEITDNIFLNPDAELKVSGVAS